MSDHTQLHPGPDDLRAFALGLIPDENPALQRHVAECPVCSQQLLAVPDDSFVKCVRKAMSGRSAPLDPTQQVGDYRLVREVGRGGMGVVYEAEQISLNRRVALKVLPPQVSTNAQMLERFRREAKAAAKLHHTNIVPVFEVGQDGDLCYYAMQYIPGESLDRVIEELRRMRHESSQTGSISPSEESVEVHAAALSLLTGSVELRSPATSQATRPSKAPLVEETDVYLTKAIAADRCSESAAVHQHSSPAQPREFQAPRSDADEPHYFKSVARIGYQTANALAYAHARGVIHRDIKPSNLLLDAAHVVWVTDFGLAKTNDDGLTNSGDLLGTLRYMAPERFRGKCDGRADVYALGLTLYELLVLRPAFSESDRLRLIDCVMERVPAPPRSLDPRIPLDLEIIVLKACQKDPSQRYQTADEMAEDLRRFLAGEPIKARRTSQFDRLRLWCRRQPAVAALTATVFLLVLTVAVGSTVLAIRLGSALDKAEKAELIGKYKLWESYVSESQARRMSRQPGQRFASLRAIEKAHALPVPPGRSRTELQTEAIAALCLADLEVAEEGSGWPHGAHAIAFDSTFERYARDDKDGNVSVRRLRDDVELFRLPAVLPLHSYNGLQFSPDGRFLHQVYHTNTAFHLRLWKLDGAQPILVLDENLTGFSFRSDSRQYATGHLDGSVRIHDAVSGKEVRRFHPTIQGGLTALKWNPRFPQIALHSSSSWRIMDSDTGQLQPEVTIPGDIFWLEWHPEGRLLAVSTAVMPCTIQLYDSTTRRAVRAPFTGHRNSGVMFCFNRAGDRLLSTDWNSVLRIWDVRTSQELVSQPATTCYLEFGPDDGTLGVDLSASKIRLFRFRGGQEFCTVQHAEKSRHGVGFSTLGIPALDPTGRFLACSAGDGMALVDVVRSEEVAYFNVPRHAALAFEPDGALLSAGVAGVLRWPLTVDKATGRRRFGPPERLAESRNYHFHGVSGDGQTIASPTGSGAVVRHRRDGRVIKVGSQKDVRNCAVSPDGRWLATGSHGPMVPGMRIWDANTGEHVKDLPANVHGIVRFSPDGKWLLTTADGCRLWRVGSWQQGPELKSLPTANGGAFSADSKLLAIGDAPGIVRLIEVPSGTEIARLSAPVQARLAPCCFTPDGSRLITVSPETQALHIFDLRAIRAQLVEMDLDWNLPPLPPAAPGSPEPLHIDIVQGLP
jgi:serine/threonine protein kinase/WD40 repeat protein